MNRRGFLASMLAACAAPAIVRADSLMRIVPRDVLVARPIIDTLAVREWIAVQEPLLDPRYQLAVARAARALADAIDRDVLNCLTLGFPARKFPNRGGIVRPQKTESSLMAGFFI